MAAAAVRTKPAQAAPSGVGMSLSPHVSSFVVCFFSPRTGRAGFDTILVDHAPCEKRFVMVIDKTARRHAFRCSARPLTAMAMVFHGLSFVASLPHRQTAT